MGIEVLRRNVRGERDAEKQEDGDMDLTGPARVTNHGVGRGGFGGILSG